MIKQIIPKEFCLKCQGCCRFAQADSVWSPCLMDEEIQELLDKDIPSAFITAQRKICLIKHPSQDGFICPFLETKGNHCKIYALRPFECQLYPFLLTLRGTKIILTVDINCPYIKDNLKTSALKEYSEYLTAFLNSPEQIEILKDNSHLLQAYQQVLDLIELRDIDAVK
jgi:Fe-S-cluster containining protein